MSSLEAPLRSGSGVAGAADLVVEVGVDLTAVTEVSDSIERLGRRYLRRLFTDHELATCGGEERPHAESLAARFAAKEAALKVLRPDGARPEWRDIEVARNRDGSCDVRLHGVAAALAAARGFVRMSLSMSHEAGLAVAVVAATRRLGAPATGSSETWNGQGGEQ